MNDGECIMKVFGMEEDPAKANKMKRDQYADNLIKKGIVE